MATTVSTPSPVTASVAEASVERLRRIFSLTGAAPLAVFVAVHAFVNAFALRGERAFASAEDGIAAIPLLTVIELLLVYAPLLVHGALGLWLWMARPATLASTPYPPGVRSAVRVTAIGALAFILWHVAELHLHAPGGSRGSALATILVRDLSSTSHGVPWRGVGYLVGAGCVVFHLAAGGWGAFAASEFGRSDLRHRRIAGWAAAAIGAVLWLLMVDVVVLHATGSRLFGGSVDDPPALENCP